MSLKAMTKKTKYITIAVALCFILAGILICTGVLLATGFDLSKLDNSVYTTSSYEFKDEIDAINIDCAVTDVTIELSKDNLCTVTCFEDETLPHTVTLQEGTLNITSTKTKWYTHIKPFSFKSSAVIICLPEDIYKTLNASVSTGSISLQNISADEIKLTASTGDISIINAKQCENIDATVSTGDINILSTVCNKLTTKATTGSVALNNVKLINVYAETSTGDICLQSTIAENTISTKASTGDIFFADSDSRNITAHTTTGDITGTILTNKIFVASTNTGDVSVPQTQGSGIFEASASTGDIIINYSESN